INLFIIGNFYFFPLSLILQIEAFIVKYYLIRIDPDIVFILQIMDRSLFGVALGNLGPLRTGILGFRLVGFSDFAAGPV
ncbi:hypothetical protein ACQWHL_27100, partial [Salmonella enterica subsp. enterica serovar Infantis]